jgi:hypothetical protein
MNEISGEDVGVTKCGHIFCYGCLKTSINNLGKCPMCQTPHKNNEISMISYEKPVYTKENLEILKNKLELINNVGTKLTNLIYWLNSIPDNVIIFSQWDLLLRKVGDVLSDHGIKNVFCRGNVFCRDKAVRDFMEENYKVIMLSADNAASGINLTKATKVIFLEPISGDYEKRKNTEWQGIGRAYRLGQTKSVEIVRLIIKDTIEEEIYRENKIEDLKQKSKLNISEITDETITLSDDKLLSISESVKRSKIIKDEKIKERNRKNEEKKLKLLEKKNQEKNDVVNNNKTNIVKKKAVTKKNIAVVQNN